MTSRPLISRRHGLAAWLAFWSLVKINDAIADIHRRTYAGYRARLEDLLTACDTGVDARLAAIGLTAVVDGLWLELCLDPTVFTPAEAGAIAERLLAGYSPTPAGRKSSRRRRG